LKCLKASAALTNSNSKASLGELRPKPDRDALYW
jgi:hypothetical protein